MLMKPEKEGNNRHAERYRYVFSLNFTLWKDYFCFENSLIWVSHMHTLIDSLPRQQEVLYLRKCVFKCVLLPQIKEKA